MPTSPGALLSKATEHMDRGEPDKAEVLIERFMKQFPKEERTTQLMMNYHIVAARLHTRKTEHLDAVRHCMESLRLAEQTGDAGAKAGTLRWLGHIDWRRGDYHMGLEHLEQGLKKAREAAAKDVEGSILIEMGNCLINLKHVEAARVKYKEAIALFGPSSSCRELSRALNNLGDTYLQCNELVTAIEYFDKSKAVPTKDPNMKAWAMMNKAECLFKMDRLEDAKREVGESLPIMKRTGDMFGFSMANAMMGIILSRIGRSEEGEQHLITSRKIAHDIGMPVHEATVVRDLGMLYLQKGDKGAARKFFEEARAVFKEHDSKINLARVETDLETLDKGH